MLSALRSSWERPTKQIRISWWLRASGRLVHISATYIMLAGVAAKTGRLEQHFSPCAANWYGDRDDMNSEKNSYEGSVNNRAILNESHRRTLVFSPLRLMLTLALCIFVIETLVMVLLERYQLPKNVATLLDSTTLTVTLFAILYYVLFRPLVGLLNDYKRNETDLKTNQEQLEQKVQERTAELNKAYFELTVENQKTLKAREELRESENRFRQLFEQSEDAIILISPQDNAILDVNPTAERVFRKQREEILEGGLPALCAPEGSDHLAAAIGQILRDDSPGVIEKFRCILEPGEIHYLSFHGKKISLQGFEAIYTTFRDITMRVRLEEQALEIQARLIQANRMTSLGTMVSSVAHEINNPNNFLLMNTRIIKRAWEDIVPVVEEYYRSKGDFNVAQSKWSEARAFLPEALAGIQEGAHRINDIVGNLKSYGQDDRASRNSVADLNSVVQLSTSILSHLISSSTNRFTLKLAEDLPLARGSARQLEQVVINLIQNALLALPDPEHTVTVETALDPEIGQLLIRVSDEGVGIPPEISDRVMEPFFTTRLNHGGTGLGLAICSTIVKEHGGSIEFSSRQGQGTTFTVRLSKAGPPENKAEKSEADDAVN